MLASERRWLRSIIATAWILAWILGLSNVSHAQVVAKTSVGRQAEAGRPTVVSIANVLVKPRYQSSVPAESVGRIREVLVVPGDNVQAGQILAKLDDKQAALKLRQLEAEIRRLKRAAEDDSQVRIADKTRAVATKDYQRAVAAAKTFPKSVSQAEIDRLKLSIERAEIEIERANIESELRRLIVGEKGLELEAATINLKKFQVTALRAGLIAEQLAELGEWAVAGQPVFRLIGVAEVRVEGLLPAHVNPQRFLHARATLDIKGHSTPFKGNVEFVAAEENDVSGVTRFWVLVDNAQGTLRPGDQGKMTLEAEE
jgi:multidrug efflux pump subunit AcrA (membrane-fusion protein)